MFGDPMGIDTAKQRGEHFYRITAKDLIIHKQKKKKITATIEMRSKALP